MVASSSASTLKSAAMLFESRHVRMRRVAQSSTAARYTKPRFMGRDVMFVAQT